MTSLHRSVGGTSTFPNFAPGVGGGIRHSSLFFGGGSHSGVGGSGGAAYHGGSLGPLRSPWISRLRPPPPPPLPLPGPLLPPAAESQRDAAAAAVRSVRGRGIVSTHRPHSPAADLERRPVLVPRCHDAPVCFRGQPPPLGLPLSSRLLCHDASVAAASSSGQHVLQQLYVQQQERETEAELGIGHVDVAEVEEEGQGEGHCMEAGFGPFQVRAKRARRLPLARSLIQEQELIEWKLEGEKGGCNRGNGQLVAGAFAKGNCGSFVRDGFFPFFQRMVRLGPVSGVGEEVADRDREEKELLPEDEGGRISRRPGGGQRETVKGEGCRLRETSLFPQRDVLRMSSNISTPSNMVNGNANGSLQIIKSNQWLHRHRWGQNSKFLDYCPASSSWSVGNGSIMRRHLLRSCIGPRRVIDETSRQKLHGQRIMVPAQGADHKEYADDEASTRTFDAPHSKEVAPQQFVIQSSFWNIERVETHIMPPLCPSLTLDKGCGRKRILDPDVSVLPRSKKLKILD